MGSVSMLAFTSFVAVLLLMLPLNVCTEAKVQGSKPRKNDPPMAVQGVVYCKPCKYQGVDTLLDAKPLSGANVNLTCEDHNRPWHKHLVYEGKTDANGYFFIRAGYLGNFSRFKCYVSLATQLSPLGTCDKLTNLNIEDAKAELKYKPPSPNIPLINLYTVGPFAYEPSICPH